MLNIPQKLFPECVARGPVSLWGCGGWALFARRCATVRNRSQPSATVRNRTREVAMAVPMVSSVKKNIFVVSQRSIASFRIAGVALCDIPTCFMTRQKRFCVAGTILLRRFQKMHCIFRGRRTTLETSDVILRGRRSTFDVSCCVDFANRIVNAARSGDKVQIPWQQWHFLTCDEKLTEASHETSILRWVPKKTLGKTSILTLRIVKIEAVAHEMLVLMLQHAT